MLNPTTTAAHLRWNIRVHTSRDAEECRPKPEAPCVFLYSLLYQEAKREHPKLDGHGNTADIRAHNQCSRQYPCNHCTRRRRPEQRTYQSQIPGNGFNESVQSQARVGKTVEDQSELAAAPVMSTISPLGTRALREPGVSNSLPDVYGSVEYSHVNTLGLLRRVVRIDLKLLSQMLMCYIGWD
jgi:hypothetical protein